MARNNSLHKPIKKSRFFLKLIAFFVGIGIIGVVALGILVIETYPKLPKLDELRNYQPKLPLEIYSADNVLIGQFGQEHRIFLSINNTPKMLINAILAAEDERFYQHGGIDYLGVLRAAVSNVTSGHIQSGASTITMQVAKNFFLSSKRSFSRKFEEALLSYKIEKSFSKDQILELYINQIFLGQRAYGFAEAAVTYFGKPIDKLSVAEYAVLAGLPKAPSAYNPVVNKNRSHERELYVLGRMKALGFITTEQYDEAVAQKINVIHGSADDSTDTSGYVAEMVRQMLYAKLGEATYTQGYKVYTTIDSKMQQQAYVALRNGLLKYDQSTGYRGAEQQLNLSSDAPNDDITNQIIISALADTPDYGDLEAAVVIDSNNDQVKARLRNGNDVEFKGDQLNFVRKYLTTGGDKQLKRGAVIRVRNTNNQWEISQTPIIEGSIIAINPNNGGIKALIGGFDYDDNSFNHVTQAMRQPGSGFKPFVYSAALDKGFSADTIIDDSPICFPDGTGKQYCPKNDERDFSGPISFRYALTKSLNVPTVKIINQITPQYTIDYLTKFGFNKSQFQPYLTLALGADEVTPLQMAQAYAVFANGGYLVQPYIVSYITDNKGNIVAKTSPVDISSQKAAIDPRNAYIMNSILQDVVRYGTGGRAYRELHRNDMAGKTGTTSDARDVWFNGYTPNLVAITWVGYDQPKSLGSHAYGASIALPIWIDFMRQVLPGIPEVQLPMPPGITVKPNATWKGNDEYVYENSSDFVLKSDASGGIIQKQNASGIINNGSPDNAQSFSDSEDDSDDDSNKK